MLWHGQDRNAKAGLSQATAKYSQAETSEGIARKRSATAEQGETWQRQGDVQKCGVEATLNYGLAKREAQIYKQLYSDLLNRVIAMVRIDTEPDGIPF